MDINIGSENVKKQQQLAIMEEAVDGMSVPNWLVDVLKWITRMELINLSLSFSCRIFKRLCLPKMHGHIKAHIVPYLEFCCKPDKFGDLYCILKRKHQYAIPIAKIPPPQYILGFELVKISVVDNQVIEFVKNIANEKIELSIQRFLRKSEENDKQQQIMLIRRLLEAFDNNIYKMSFFTNYINANSFSEFYNHFPAFLNQVPFIYISNLFDSDFEILFNWLIIGSIDGSQKIVNYIIYDPNDGDHHGMEIQLISRIKKEFSNSTEARNFLIALNYEYEHFLMQNQHTGEVLNLYHEMTPEGYLKNFLARYPIGEEHWKEGSFVKISENKILMNRNIYIDIDELKEDMKNNKLNFLDRSPDLTINDAEILMANMSSAHSYNSVRATMPVQFHFFGVSRLNEYIVCYFEVKILNHWDVGIGFSNENFPLQYDPRSSQQYSKKNKNDSSIEYYCLGGLRNSIGLWCREGAHIDGAFKPFGKAICKSLYGQNDVIGCGLLHSREKFQFFGTLNGTLLGKIELPSRFLTSGYYPTITLGSPDAAIRVNFGKEAFCFDREKLFNEK